MLYSCHVLVETDPCPAVRDALMAKSYTDKHTEHLAPALTLITGLAPIADGQSILRQHNLASEILNRVAT
jgi:hypothetical protein